jgi:hypothetical protein
MRNDHAFHGFAGGELPTPEEIASAMARAHRMRSEAVHGYLARLAAWLRGALRPAPKDPVAQCC